MNGKEPATGEAAGKSVPGRGNIKFKAPEVGTKSEIREPEGQRAREAGCGGDCKGWSPLGAGWSNTQRAGVRCAQSQLQGFVTSDRSLPTLRLFSHL